MNIKDRQVRTLRERARQQIHDGDVDRWARWAHSPEIQRILKESDKYARRDVMLQVGALWLARCIVTGLYAAFSLQQNTYHGRLAWGLLGLRCALVLGFVTLLSYRRNAH